MHGAFAGAPSGKRNGAYRHGHFTFDAMVERARAKLSLETFRDGLSEAADALHNLSRQS